MDSGVDHPDKGDESVLIISGKNTYRLKVLHPKVINGPHFSVPFFWVGFKDKGNDFNWNSLVSKESFASGLTWHSASGYFFEESEKKKNVLRYSGFLTIDGQDNADWGATGLLFLYDTKKSSIWKWTYTRSPEKSKGHFKLESARIGQKGDVKAIRKRLSSLFEYAEKQADAWPGP